MSKEPEVLDADARASASDEARWSAAAPSTC